MKNLPKNHHQLADMIYHCIELSEYDGKSLKQVIEQEKGKSLSLAVVEDWLRGSPSACTIPFKNHEIEQILNSSGCGHWSIDNYWRWAASRVEAFAKYPNAIK